MSEALRLRPHGMSRVESPIQASQAYGAAQMRAMPGVRLNGAGKAAKAPQSDAGLLGHWALWAAVIGLLGGGVVLGASFTSAPKPVRIFPVPVTQLQPGSPAASQAAIPQAQVRPHTASDAAAYHPPTIIMNSNTGIGRLIPGESEREALAPPPPPPASLPGGAEAQAMPTELSPPAAIAEPSKQQVAELAAPPALQQPAVQQPALQQPAQSKPTGKSAPMPVAAIATPPALSAQTSAPTAGGERWRKLGVPMPAGAKPPFIAIVIDDMGLARRNSTRAVALPAPLTLSYMSYAPDLPEQTAAARAAGHELMLHLPMEPLDVKRNNPGPYALLVNQDEGEWRRRTLWSLDRFEGFAGVNNHMGSRFTADAQAMGIVLSEIHKRGLFWLDSLTGPRSTGVAQAGRLGMASTGRDLFLDNERDAEAGVPAQLAILERIAREHGDAIGIGHPHAQTLSALERWLVEAPKRGFTLISASAMLQHRLEKRQAQHQ